MVNFMGCLFSVDRILKDLPSVAVVSKAPGNGTRPAIGHKI
jgi:hypothetical protein